MPDCEHGGTFDAQHEGLQRCADDGRAVCVEKIRGIPSTPHGCFCSRDPGHGAFCLIHQQDHASGVHGSSQPAVFPRCGGLHSLRGLVDAVTLHASNVRTGHPVQRRLSRSLTLYLNVASPGAASLMEIWKTTEDRDELEFRPDRKTWAVAGVVGARFSPDFFVGGTLERFVLLSTHSLGTAVANGFAPKLPGAASLAQWAEGKARNESGAEISRDFVNAIVERAFRSLERLTARGSLGATVGRTRTTRWLEAALENELPDSQSIASWLVGERAFA